MNSFGFSLENNNILWFIFRGKCCILGHGKHPALQPPALFPTEELYRRLPMHNMADISDLADLRFEDLAEADLCDLVRCGVSVDEGGEDGGGRLCSPSPPPQPCSSLMLLLQGREAKAYTHITLINGERICLKEEDEEEGGGGDEEEDGRYSPDSHSLDMDLNYVLQAGVVERVASSSSS